MWQWAASESNCNYGEWVFFFFFFSFLIIISFICLICLYMLYGGIYGDRRRASWSCIHPGGVPAPAVSELPSTWKVPFFSLLPSNPTLFLFVFSFFPSGAYVIINEPLDFEQVWNTSTKQWICWKESSSVQVR